MIKFAEEEKRKGNMGPIIEKIIMKTGNNETMFKHIKHYVYNLRIKEIEELNNAYNYQKTHEINKASQFDENLFNQMGDSKKIKRRTAFLSEKEKNARQIYEKCYNRRARAEVLSDEV